ncbi:hypothetical protein [Aquisalinus flavus]|nr:hypothetical protein [Aquisalinus flavus]MBD0425780.1 hypothetical protein [Aquisalinus flavus]UNE48613.1 hypothetical protein FF099_11425 [Aquisalinus flavus]
MTANSSNAEPGSRVTFGITDGETRHQVYFASTDMRLASRPEIEFVTSILPCMKKGRAFRAPAPLDPRLLASFEQIQDLYLAWVPGLTRLPAKAFESAAPRPRAGTGRVAAFFSGGVDSFYTLMKRREEITDLIFVHGFDIKLGDEALYRETLAMIEHIAGETGKNLIRLETNIRPVLDSYIGWDYGHGPALAATAYLLSDQFDKIYIPSSQDYTHLFAFGSHPLLDPLWSLSDLDIVNDGAEARRIRKVEAIARHQIVLDTLRVCWMNPDSAYNCCRCEKCHRTMIALKVVGALDRCRTFPEPLRNENIRALKIVATNTRSFMTESMREAERRGLEPAFIKAMADALKGQSTLQRFVNNLRRAISQPGRALAKIRRKAGF